MIVYIVLKLCVDVEGVRTYCLMKLGYLVLGMADEMHPIAYRERRGGLSPPGHPRWGGGRAPLLLPPPPHTPPPCDAQLIDIRVVCEKSMGVGVVTSKC